MVRQYAANPEVELTQPWPTAESVFVLPRPYWVGHDYISTSTESHRAELPSGFSGGTAIVIRT